ncbi:hypothetical protein SeLEV6574_g06074 [Synchytrium endobioticum]|nr:hypothetical protein SeLEV6574_g06074 [Synchytrium endobioticum]
MMDRSPSTNSIRSSVSDGFRRRRNVPLEQLIQKHLGSITNVSKYDKLLRFHKFGSTDRHQVHQRLERLVERFQLFGLDDRGSALESLINKVETVASSDITDCLRLILDLSDSPIRALWRSYDLEQAEKAAEALNLTWQDIVQDDPLQGDHWSVRTMEGDEFLDGDDEGYDEGIFTDESSRSASFVQTGKSGPLAKMLEAIQYERPLLLKGLKQIQYWNRQSESVPDTIFDFNLPTTLSVALVRHEQKSVNHFHRASASTNYVSEVDLLREVLFLLSGNAACIFREVLPCLYDVDMKVALTHATSGAVCHMLAKFAEVGSMLARIRLFSKQVQLDTNMHLHSRTIQTFADAVGDLVVTFDSKTATLQRHYQSHLRDSEGGTGVASLLELWDGLHNDFDLVIELDNLVDRVTQESDSFALIARLYSLVGDQLLINSSTSSAMLTLFVRTLRPALESIECFINAGALGLAGDSIIKRIKDVPKQSPEFWFESLRLRYVVVPFLKVIADDVLVTGKSRMLLNECRVKQVVDETRSLYDEFVAIVKTEIGLLASPFCSSAVDDTDTPLTIQAHLCITTMPSPNEASQSSTLPSDRVVSLENVITNALQSLIHPRRLRVGRLLTRTLRSRFGIEHQLHVLPRCCFMLEGKAMSDFCSGLYQYTESRRELCDASVIHNLFMSAIADCCDPDDFQHIRWLIPAKWKSQALSFTMLEDIKIDHEATWPTSLFISEAIRSQYNTIACLLIQAKYVQLGLEKDVVIGNKRQHSHTRSRETENLWRALRSRLLQFVQGLLSHLLHTVIAESIYKFEQAIRNADELNVLISSHTQLVQNVFSQCLLHPRAKPVMTPIRRILGLSHDLAFHYSEGRHKVMLPDDDRVLLLTGRRKFEEWRMFVVNALRSSRGRQLESLAVRLDF